MTKPLRISWSAIRTHEECHQRSFLQREGKRAKVTNIRNFFPGTVVDAAMRVWLDLPTHSERPSMADLVVEVMNRSEAEEKERGNIVRFRNPQDRAEVQTFCTELVNRLEPILRERVLPYPHQHGHWFKVPMKLTDANNQPRDVLLTGEMDLLVQHPQGSVVWDLKGTADDQYYRKVVAQLTFYDLALWASTGKKTHYAGLIQPMCTERLMAWQITDDARRNLMTRIHRYALDVWAGEKTCTENRGVCHFCDVKHACSRFDPAALDGTATFADAFRKAAAKENT